MNKPIKKALKNTIKKILRRNKWSRRWLYNRTQKNQSPRRYIDPALGVAGFFEQLNKLNINYCVLRWFDDLPSVARGEDIDILVSDDDLDNLNQFLNGYPDTGTACDVYTETGGKKTSWTGIPYYPPKIAETILSGSSIKSNNVRSPNKDIYFLSLSYHAVFHKGYDSGLRDVSGVCHTDNPEHDYPTILKKLAVGTGRSDLTINLEGLKIFLEQKGWLPAYDTLEKIAQTNEYVKNSILNSSHSGCARDDLIVYIIREQGIRYLTGIKKLISDYGFIIHYESKISHDSNVMNSIRGGVWGSGPYPASGGLPSYLLICTDTHPKIPNKRLAQQHFGLVNENFYRLKKDIRAFVNQHLEDKDRCNTVHSSDNYRQAFEYLAVIHGIDMAEEIISRIDGPMESVTIGSRNLAYADIR